MIDLIKIIAEKIYHTMDGVELGDVDITIPKDKDHGDYATAIALKIGRAHKRNPMDIAHEIAGKIGKNKELFQDVTVKEPGFINCFISNAMYAQVLDSVGEDHHDKIRTLLNGPSNRTLLDDPLVQKKIKSLQYTHSRIYSILEILKDEGYTIDNGYVFDFDSFDLEREIIRKIGYYPQVVKNTVKMETPQEMMDYVMDLSGLFQRLDEITIFRKLDRDRLYGILKIMEGLRRIIKNFLMDMDIEPPKKM